MLTPFLCTLQMWFFFLVFFLLLPFLVCLEKRGILSITGTCHNSMKREDLWCWIWAVQRSVGQRHDLPHIDPRMLLNAYAGKCDQPCHQPGDILQTDKCCGLVGGLSASEMNTSPRFGSGTGWGGTAGNRNSADFLQWLFSFTPISDPAQSSLPAPMGGIREQKIDQQQWSCWLFSLFVLENAS